MLDKHNNLLGKLRQLEQVGECKKTLADKDYYLELHIVYHNKPDWTVTLKLDRGRLQDTIQQTLSKYYDDLSAEIEGELK